MSKIEIIEELPRLTREDRLEIRLKLAELDGDEWLDDDDPLTPEDKALIELRIAAHEKDPGAAIPWSEFRCRTS
ncbi:MAG: hypothetical protein ABIP75_06930 [Pyrinomonadaceae bacterium]